VEWTQPDSLTPFLFPSLSLLLLYQFIHLPALPPVQLSIWAAIRLSSRKRIQVNDGDGMYNVKIARHAGVGI